MEKVRAPLTLWPSAEMTCQATTTVPVPGSSSGMTAARGSWALAEMAQSVPSARKACTASSSRRTGSLKVKTTWPGVSATTALSSGLVETRLACAAAGAPVSQTRAPTTYVTVSSHAGCPWEAEGSRGGATPGTCKRDRAERQPEEAGDEPGDPRAHCRRRSCRRGRQTPRSSTCPRSPWRPRRLPAPRTPRSRRRAAAPCPSSAPASVTSNAGAGCSTLSSVAPTCGDLGPRGLTLLAGLDRGEGERRPGGVLGNLQGDLEAVALAVGERGLGGVDDLVDLLGDLVAVLGGDRGVELGGDLLDVVERVAGRGGLDDVSGSLMATLVVAEPSQPWGTLKVSRVSAPAPGLGGGDGDVRRGRPGDAERERGSEGHDGEPGEPGGG